MVQSVSAGRKEAEMLDASNRFVEVGGLMLPAEVVILALDLEARGISLSHAGDDILIHPFSALTDEDTRQLRRWKVHLLAFMDRQVRHV